ncbi:hypothetical protein PRZ48_008577 [Zasmidium cellare]|uniref:Uncharacterized protein n=1 Tax=Zasmidium cellare TaxID=395010 RepID=A0ABR0EGQ6_ZASCE|nr:hypothetical protein PRZ48_008577 [Zasmidium cellare]
MPSMKTYRKRKNKRSYGTVHDLGPEAYAKFQELQDRQFREAAEKQKRRVGEQLAAKEAAAAAENAEEEVRGPPYRDEGTGAEHNSPHQTSKSMIVSKTSSLSMNIARYFLRRPNKQEKKEAKRYALIE